MAFAANPATNLELASAHAGELALKIDEDKRRLMDMHIDGIRARHGIPKRLSPCQRQIDADRLRLGIPPVR